MESASTVAQLVDRVDRLLLRYEELQRTNQLLTDNVRIMTSEKDSLITRLSAARLRVDTLIEKLADERLRTEKQS